MRPGILNFRRQGDGVAFVQLRAIDVDFVEFQERSDARVVCRLRIAHGLAPACAGHKDQISTAASMVTRAGAKAADNAASCARSQKAGMTVRARTARTSATVSERRGWT